MLENGPEGTEKIVHFFQQRNNPVLSEIAGKIIFQVIWILKCKLGRLCDTKRSTIGYSIYKKQHTISRSSVGTEYRALAYVTTELIWVTYILRNTSVYLKTILTLFCDNIIALYITVNHVLHATTKQVEMNYPFVRGKWQGENLWHILFDQKTSQLIFKIRLWQRKNLPDLEATRNMQSTYSLAWGEVLRHLNNVEVWLGLNTWYLSLCLTRIHVAYLRVHCTLGIYLLINWCVL